MMSSADHQTFSHCMYNWHSRFISRGALFSFCPRSLRACTKYSISAKMIYTSLWKTVSALLITWFYSINQW